VADRYAYLPLVGISIALAWSGQEAFAQVKLPMAARSLASGIILFAIAATTRHQLSFWQNDGTLFGHALAVTERNSQAKVTYGVYLEKINQPAEAVKHYRQALVVDPNEKNAHFNLANLLDDAGKTDDAINEYQAALHIDPAFYPAAYNLALVLERLGRREEAIVEYKAALQLKPDFAPAKQHLQALGAAVKP
jgi:tetratricopeptide (TPR) repeat protein